MIKLSDTKRKSARKNDQKNKRLHFFASKFSIYFSWVFINLGLNANQVTGVFFLTGLASSLSFFGSGPLFAVIGYVLWRLHIIFDLCDGDVARYTQKFSINGAYWDYMIHSLLYPLTFISIMVSLYNEFSDIGFLYLGIFGSLVVSLMQAVKNNYYRAMLFNKVDFDVKKGESKASALKASVVNIFVGSLNFEGFLLAYTLSTYFQVSALTYVAGALFYICSFFSQSLLKFVLFSKNGFCMRRS